ncbi:hypothetical protein AQUCO_01400472v1 [Aquilegia coerulea]|uniref:Cytochrome P450 n=1 Tax=Aquilegia coerulea TaxID=218851 RepID=A0A2G5DWJ4_AQUCA|nr:hypothetical protein AQUCO_01400472v1 [Aquilegia coerulea]
MEFIGYPEMIFATVCSLILHYLNSKTALTNWPLIGMLPSLLLNLHRLHDWATDILSKSGCTFVFKGPWFTNMNNIVVTSDPANMRHIFITNFSNYPKGAEYYEFFDIMGDGIFNADLDSWKTQRKMALQFLNHKKFQSYLEQYSFNKVENGLIPVLEHVLEQNLVLDLQDLFKRYTFDTATIFLTGTDPCSLTTEYNKWRPYINALDDAEEAVLYRHAIPVNCWKLQRWLGIGKEKKLINAKEILDQFIAQCIKTKRASQHQKRENKEQEEKSIDLMTLYMEEFCVSDKFLRDTMMNFMAAGRGTSAALTWFFWLVSKNPAVETKLIEELKSTKKSAEKEGSKILKMFDTEELKGLVYLHGAFCEALRLFPSVPFEHKRPLQPDILPSGHKVDSKTKILPLLYSMGRMEEVWGKDCLEFRPERWISEEGGIKYVPSYKFMAFNAGPRTCLGKEIVFTQMRSVAATLLYNYQVEVVEGHSISLKNSIILNMNHGMNTRIKRRL